MPYVYKPLNVYKWALGANGHLGNENPKCPVPISLKNFQMGSGENGHLGQPKYPFPSNSMPICPTAHLQKFGGNGHRALVVYPVRALEVPLLPKRSSAHLPWCP